MSNLALNTCGNALQALACLFNSEKFTMSDINNASAMLSQKGVSIEIQKFENIVEFMLNEWGIGFDTAIKTDTNKIKYWAFDSVTFLAKNPCLIGFLLKYSDDNWGVVRNINNNWEWQKNKLEWDRIERHEIINKMLSLDCPVFLLWKKWIPLQKWVNEKRPFYVRNADSDDNSRWEYEPTSCWMPQKMVYQGKNDKLKKILKKWDSQCLISNAKQFLLLKPSNEGWNTETIMEFDGLPKATVADRLAGLVESKIYEQIAKNPTLKTKIMPHLAHAFMAVASKFDIKINHQKLSAFQTDEDFEEILRNYDKELEKIS